jgi:D-tagatose-1,6-bisphosphate aldolase subunit GatZ/KbaZ
MMPTALAGLRPGRAITSVCSAHPVVIEAALRFAAEQGLPALIEATCNQVNPDGGYTGLTPAGFRDAVVRLAARVGLPPADLILGGDHLGPNPWRALPAAAAMAMAEAMVAAYAEAGFVKLHLDTSMGCAGEPDALPDELTAARAARLAVVAEAAAVGAGVTPCYVVGTEVPTPGGAREAIAHLEVTRPEAARATHAVHRRAFAAAGVAPSFDRVIALVVQPGVEFGHTNVAIFRPEAATALSATLADLPVVFEAHSTDYQPAAALAALARGGFAILKVGPALTFALREALYGLDAIAAALDPAAAPASLVAAMERVMLDDPRHWRGHYQADPTQCRLLRHYSYSDRIRYYWTTPAATAAVAELTRRLAATSIPETLISQFLPRLHERVMTGALAATVPALVEASVRDVLRSYAAAATPYAAEA